MKFLLFIFLLTVSTTHTQEFNADSAVYSSDALNRLYIVGLQSLNEDDIVQAEISFRSIVAFPYRSEDWRTIRYYKGKAHFYLGDIYFIKKNYEKASFNYNLVVREYGEIEEYSSALFKLGRSLIFEKKEKEGIDILQDYIYNYGEQDGFVDNALYWIANAYLSLNYNTAALKTLNQILRDFPNSPIAYEVRILASKLQVSPQNESSELIAEQQKIENTQRESQTKVNKLEDEKMLITKMSQLLTLKEKFLLIKERKLNLLDEIGKARVEALKNNRELIESSITFE